MSLFELSANHRGTRSQLTGLDLVRHCTWPQYCAALWWCKSWNALCTTKSFVYICDLHSVKLYLFWKRKSNLARKQMALKKKASMLASLLVFLTLLNFSAGLYFENVTVIFSVRSYIQSAFVCAFLSTCIEIFCTLSLCTPDWSASYESSFRDNPSHESSQWWGLSNGRYIWSAAASHIFSVRNDPYRREDQMHIQCHILGCGKGAS